MGLDQYLYRTQTVGGYDTATTVIIKSGDKTEKTTTNQPIHLKTEVAYWRKNYLLGKLIRRHCIVTEDTYDVGISYDDIQQLHYLMKSALDIADWQTDEQGGRVITNRREVLDRLEMTMPPDLTDEELLTGLEEGVEELSKVRTSHEQLIEAGVNEDDIEYTYEESW